MRAGWCPRSMPPTPPTPPALLDGEGVPRSGTGGTVPSTFTTGYRYAGLGYTTVFDAAVAPVMARHSHAEMDDTPCVDAGFFALLGNDEYLLRQIDAGERDRARDYIAWVLGRHRRIRGEGGEPRRHRGVEGGAAEPDRSRPAARRPAGDPARHSRDHHRRGERAPRSRTRRTSTATTWASRGTPPPRSPPCRRWRAAGRTSPISSFTATAAPTAPGGDRRRRA